MAGFWRFPLRRVAVLGGFLLGLAPLPAVAAFKLHRPEGLPVYAATPGRVLFTGYASGLGQVVDIDQGHGFATRYEHLNRILVQPGQTVAQHQLIGLVGDTGWNMWPNLVVRTAG